MAKLSKFKYIIICLVILAVIVSATAFSVSYASWVGGSTTLTAGGATGKWVICSPEEVDISNLQWGNDFIGTKNAAVYSSSLNGTGQQTTNYENIGNNYSYEAVTYRNNQTTNAWVSANDIGKDTGWVYYMYFKTTSDLTYATFVMSKGSGGDTGDATVVNAEATQIARPTSTAEPHPEHSTAQVKNPECNNGCLYIDGCSEVTFQNDNTVMINKATEDGYVYELCYYIPKDKVNNSEKLGNVLYTLKKIAIADMKPSTEDLKKTDLYTSVTTTKVESENTAVTAYIVKDEDKVLERNRERILVL